MIKKLFPFQMTPLTKKFLLSIISLILNTASSFWRMTALVVLAITCDNIIITNRAEEITREVNGMVWGTGKQMIRAQLTDLPSSHDPEEQFLLLTLYNAENKTLFEKQFAINWDLFGSGFIKAMQVDNDPELEIVFYNGRSARMSKKNKHLFFSDTPIRFNCYLKINPQTAQIQFENFNTALPEIREIAQDINGTLNPLHDILLYIFFIPVILAIKIFASNLRKSLFTESSKKST
jgi:hypothetical protein